MYSEKIFDFRCCHGGEKSIFFSDPGPSNQSELLRRVYTSSCAVLSLIPSINQEKNKIKTDHIMYTQKFSILGGAMVEKNHFFFRIQDQVTKVSCCAEYCTSLCAVLSFIPSINQEKKQIKTDHVMHSQKYSILGNAMVEKKIILCRPQD